MGWRPRTRGSLEPRHGTSMKVDAPLALNEQSYQPKQVVKQFAPKNKVVKQGARARAPLHTGPLSNTTTWRALFRSLERLLRFVGKVHSVAWACYLKLVNGETSLLADKVALQHSLREKLAHCEQHSGTPSRGTSTHARLKPREAV